LIQQYKGMLSYIIPCLLCLASCRAIFISPLIPKDAEVDMTVVCDWNIFYKFLYIFIVILRWKSSNITDIQLKLIKPLLQMVTFWPCNVFHLDSIQLQVCSFLKFANDNIFMNISCHFQFIINLKYIIEIITLLIIKCII